MSRKSAFIKKTKRLRKYPDYKDAGVEWLGQVPSHWEVKRLRFVIYPNPTKSEVRNLDEDTPVSFVPMEAIGEQGGIYLDAVKPLIDVLDGYTYFHDGDVIVAKITPCFENGKGALARGLENGIGFGTTELHVLRVKPSTNAQFIFYLTLSDHFRRIGTAAMYGAGGQKRVPEDFIRDLKHPIPDLEEQRSIAAFLDRETAKIDALVEKKQKLIELLKEKRTSLITRAVTKGLDPNVPMKDSGIEWLGTVPKSWKVLAIKHVTAIPITDGPHETPMLFDEGVPFISAEAIKDDKIDFSKMRGFISLKAHKLFSKKYKPKKGDIYLIKSGATTGNVALVDTDKEFNIWSPLAAVRPDRKQADAKFVFYFMKSRPFLQSIELGWSYGTQQNIGMNVIGNIPIALPLPREQKVISEFLDDETAKIDVMMNKIHKGIDRLKEYRTALISAAVTGKIDVRGEVS